MKLNEKKLEKIMLALGHRDNLVGTEYLRLALDYYWPGCSITKEVYPCVAKAAGSTASRVERAMRHSIATAWDRGSVEAQQEYFGWTVNPETGVPTVGEYLARLWRVCVEN